MGKRGYRVPCKFSERAGAYLKDFNRGLRAYARRQAATTAGLGPLPPLDRWDQTNTDQHSHRNRSDLHTLTGFLPTLDGQSLPRAPVLSSHLTHVGLTGVEGLFYDAPDSRTVLICQDASSQLACTLSPPPGPMPAPHTPSIPPSPPWTASLAATTPTASCTSSLTAICSAASIAT